MKKKLTVAALALVMVLSMVPAALAAEASPTNDKLTVDGVAQNPTVYKIGGSNYFKIRDLAAILNGTSKQFAVGYDASTSSVTATTGEGYVKTDADLAGPPAGGSKSAELSGDVIYVNGVRTEAEVYKIDGNNYFKLRDLGDALGFAVDWNAEQGMIINTGDSSAPTQPTTPVTTTVSAYKEYPMIPDFGVFAGIKCIGSGEDEYGYIYVYDGADVLKEDAEGEVLKQYWEILEQAGFEMDDVKKGDQGTIVYFHSDVYKDITVAFNTAAMGNGKALLINVIDYSKKETAPSQPSTSDTSNGSGYYAAWPQVRDLGAFTGVAPYSVSQSGNATRYKYSIAELAQANPDFITEYADLIMKDGFYRSHSYDIRNGTTRVGKGIVFSKGKVDLVFKYDSTEGSGLGTVTISIGTDPF